MKPHDPGSSERFHFFAASGRLLGTGSGSLSAPPCGTGLSAALKPGQNWLTFRQALGLGGHVRKGKRGTTVVYADRFTPDDERRRAAEAGEEPGAIPFLKRFTVHGPGNREGFR